MNKKLLLEGSALVVMPTSECNFQTIGILQDFYIYFSQNDNDNKTKAMLALGTSYKD